MNTESLSHAVSLTFTTVKHSPELLLFFVLLLCLIRELRKPWRAFSRRSLGRSYRSNLATFLFNDTVLSLLSLPSLFYVAQNFSGYGLLSRMPDGLAKALIAFVLLDLMMYAWHVANHRCEALWRFHKVHHSDTTLNVTTGLRFHVGELALTALLKAGFIVLIGVPVGLAMLNEIILSCFVLFHHTNSSLRGEKLWGRLFIMPWQHRLHHSTVRDQHDHNYGGALVLWDRLFGTLGEGEPEAIGLNNVKEQGFWEMLRFGVITYYNRPGKACPMPVRASHEPH